LPSRTNSTFVRVMVSCVSQNLATIAADQDGRLSQAQPDRHCLFEYPKPREQGALPCPFVAPERSVPYWRQHSPQSQRPNQGYLEARQAEYHPPPSHESHARICELGCPPREPSVLLNFSRLSRPPLYSAASLAPLRFFLPPAFASTGARNLPV
jgi:hypothetical protein